MIYRNGLTGLAVVLALGVSLPAMAADLMMDEPAPMVVDDAQSAVTISGGIGVLWLEGNEYVYQSSTSDDRLSHLIWQSTAPVLTAGLDVALPEGWTFSAKAQVGMGGDSYMEDYDWIEPFAGGNYGDDDWTHRSQHEDTNLDWYFNGTVLAGYNVIANDGLTVNLNAGFKYTDVQWAATGGSYIYSDMGFRDSSGDFPDEPAITYHQQFPAVIAGLDVQFVQDALTIDLGAHAGATFSATSQDNHWMRDLVITDEIQTAGLVQVSGQASFAVTDDMSIFLGGTLEQILTARADAHYDFTPDPDSDYLDGQGADLFAATLTAGVKGTF